MIRIYKNSLAKSTLLNTSTFDEKIMEHGIPEQMLVDKSMIVNCHQHNWSDWSMNFVSQVSNMVADSRFLTD